MQSAEQLAMLRNRASQAIKRGQWASAQSLLEALTEEAPHYTPAWLELADVVTRRGYWAAARLPLLRAAEQLPRNAPLVLELTQLVLGHGEICAARRCLDFLATAPEPPVDLVVKQARLRFAMGEFDVALRIIERALAMGADEPDDHDLRALLLQFTGDMEGAVRELEECVTRWPAYGDAAVTLVNSRRQTPGVNLLDYVKEQLRALPERPTGRDQKFVRAEFEYVRFKILDDLGHYSEAWGALEQCNGLMHELNPYNAHSRAAAVDVLLRACTEHGGQSAPARSQGPIPIFIVGMPRSGTTLLDRMLSSHSNVASAGELPTFFQQLHVLADVRPRPLDGGPQVFQRSSSVNFSELGERYLEQTRWRAAGAPFYVDKMPANIDLVPFIQRALPAARIVHMTRDPMDVCFSNFKAMFGNISAYSYDLKAVGHYYRQYRRMTDHWRRLLPGAMLEVCYEELVANPEPQLRRVLTHCGLEMEAACLHPERNTSAVATPSSVQVREPLHQRSVGQWRRYRRQLQPLNDALNGLAASTG